MVYECGVNLCCMFPGLANQLHVRWHPSACFGSMCSHCYCSGGQAILRMSFFIVDNPKKGMVRGL